MSSQPAKPNGGSDSSGTSEEYEIVAEKTSADEPEVKMEGDENKVKEAISECIGDAADPGPDPDPESPASSDEVELDTSMVNECRLEDDNHTVFHNISYLGSSRIAEPKNEAVIHTMIKELNVLDDLQDDANEEKTSVGVLLSVPRTSDGHVIMRSAIDRKELDRFPIYKIIFFARGSAATSCQACFAFTCHQVDPESKKAYFKCHVFRCLVVEAVTKVFVSFAQAFRKKNPAASSNETDSVDGGSAGGAPSSDEECFLFEVSLEIKEKSENNPNNYDMVPRQKGVFKLRSNVEKKVVVSVQQISKNSVRLGVERCFGMLVSPGRNVRHADMQLLEHVTMATTSGGSPTEDSEITHVITGAWDPRETAFAVLNKETPSDVTSVYLTIAADLVMNQVAEPVRFVIETRARILPQSERYWYYTKKSLVKQFSVRVKKRDLANVESGSDPDKLFDLVGIDKSEEIELNRSKMSLTLQLANLTASTFSSLKSPPNLDDDISPTIAMDEDDEDGDAEIVLSGFGEVSKDCSEQQLELWSQVLGEWDRDNPKNYPKNLPILIKHGVPEALRGEVWQRVTGASVQQEEIIETYRILITKESPDEKVILRDIHRTFPAHEFFKEAGGVGQESLYRISKAYSVYDSEVGYCQGQSFLIASLLLQMPEEQAFGVLVKVMHDLGLRDMFKENFEQLQLRLYQLDRLIEANLTDLHVHMQQCGIESHMYASQWFLTVFTAKFPLFLVFRVLDVFLLDGFDSIFQVALAILKVAKKDLLQQDFEGLMKFFRVNIPKTYRNEENAKHLMAVAKNIKLKRMHKYEKEWLAIKEAERQREDPVVRLERENKKLLADNLRLDTENDNLARELVNSKIEMRKDIDKIEDAKDYFEKELETTKRELAEASDEKKRLSEETEQLKLLLKREVDKLDAEVASKNNVIAEYKTICSQLSAKLEKSYASSANDNSKSSETTPTVTEAASKAAAPCDKKDQAEDDDEFTMRIKELEMELAQTKLALVETKCRNQELIHQFNLQQEASQAAAGATNKKWFTKTLYSIKETAVASAQQNLRGQAATSASNSAASEAKAQSTGITKSMTVDVLRNLQYDN